jgi:hypothetical protein
LVNVRALQSLAAAGLLAGALVTQSACAAVPDPVPSASAVRPQLPVLAYYYIWFNASSWNRAKRDFPTVGRYSSDETTVMRRHVRAAKQAGITGFLVSWKDTAVLDERLTKLVQVAREERFTLGIVYQGLDVRREPLPVGRVLHDLQAFDQRWGDDSVFDLYGRPLVVWAGTWRFTLPEIGLVSRAARPSLQLLASEREVDRWHQVGALVDGNAYYWSSVDPHRDLHARTRLQTMGTAVHSTHGLWIAPAAPGFDARLIGGQRAVAREDGSTLKREWANALTSSPDAIGLISWNEFTEGSYVEPSREYGDTALRTVALLTGTRGPQGELDSSAPSGRSTAGPLRAVIIVVLLGGLTAAALKRAHRGSARAGPPAALKIGSS